MSNPAIETIQALEYALAKQIPLDSQTLKINSDYGELELNNELGRKAVKALRLLIIKEAGEKHKNYRKQRAK